MTHQLPSLGEFVRFRRKASRFSQKDLGELAGVGTRFISDLERGKTTVRLNEVNKVLSVFGKQVGVIDAPKETADEES